MARRPVIPVLGEAVNAYLVVGEDGVAAIDVGLPSVAPRVERAITEGLGRPLADLRLITCTHYHVDHVGGIARLHARVPTARVFLPARIQASVRAGGPPLTFAPWRKKHRLILGDRFLDRPKIRLADLVTVPWIGMPFLPGRTPPFPVAGFLDEGDELPGFAGWKVLATPGHSPDSLSFWHAKSRSLLSGDTIVVAKKGPMLAYYHVDDEDVARSGARLAKLPVRNLYSGHGPVREDDPDVLKGIEGTLIR
jgi:glyoxylase-like metal-dependent hydrolase (beta-lactamase superfamily II)